MRPDVQYEALLFPSDRKEASFCSFSVFFRVFYKQTRATPSKNVPGSGCRAKGSSMREDEPATVDLLCRARKKSDFFNKSHNHDFLD